MDAYGYVAGESEDAECAALFFDSCGGDFACFGAVGTEVDASNAETSASASLSYIPG